MSIVKQDVIDLLRAHGLNPVSVTIQERVGQRPSVLSVTLKEEGSADRLYSALRSATRWEIGKGRDENGLFVIRMFGAHRY